MNQLEKALGLIELTPIEKVYKEPTVGLALDDNRLLFSERAELPLQIDIPSSYSIIPQVEGALIAHDFSESEIANRKIYYISDVHIEHQMSVFIKEIENQPKEYQEQAILDFIKEEKTKNKCILYSTHYMEEAENICDYVILIHKGKIISTGSPKEIEEKTQTTNLRDAFISLIEGDHNE